MELFVIQMFFYSSIFATPLMFLRPRLQLAMKPIETKITFLRINYYRD
jgi:hypothetical protein